MNELKKLLEKMPIEYQPEVRWWLAEGFHTDETLKKDIGLLHESGFGAAEFLAMDEFGCDSSKYGWGSEEWGHDTELIIEETTARGMGASVTSGTNWSNANLPDSVHMPDDKSAAKELDYVLETLSPGQQRSGKLPICSGLRPAVFEQTFIAAVAAKRLKEQDGKTVFAVSSLTDLTDRVTGDGMERMLDWCAPDDGTYDLFIFWMHGTGQTASPSVSKSYTVNYIDRYGIDKIIGYWNETVLTPVLRQAIKKNGRVQMYMDSLELSTFGQYGQFWGYNFLEEFKKRRGYELRPFLPLLAKKSGMMFGMYQYKFEGDDIILTRKIRNETYDVMTGLYMDNMLKPMQDWLHSVGMTLRAEISYGMPFEISEPGKYVDGIETESLEFASQIDSFRGLAGAAHLYDRIYSSETGATMLNYMMGLDFYTQIIFTQFASGVTKTVLHGYSSIAGSDKSTYWPGHEGMWPVFSERFGCRQPAFCHYKDWTDMLARFQMLLRQGKPRMDLGILRLDYNFNNMVFFGATQMNEQAFYESKLMRENEGIYWKDMSLQNAGYTYDYFSPAILRDVPFGNGLISPDGPAYQAIIVFQEELDADSAARLLEWVKQGLKLVIVHGAEEDIHSGVTVKHAKAASRTPYNDKRDAELADIIKQIINLPTALEVSDSSATKAALEKLGVYPRTAFSQPNAKILPLMREDRGLSIIYDYHYMYTDKKPFRFEMSIEGEGKPYYIDCCTGDIHDIGLYTHENNRTQITLELMPGEAVIVCVDKNAPQALHAISSNADAVISSGGQLMIKSVASGSYETKLSDGRAVVSELSVPAKIPLLEWDLVVEDWNEGDKQTIIEDRGHGIVTEEVWYDTRKTLIKVGKTKLVPWQEIAAIGPEVSGVGTYTASLKLPDGWDSNSGAFLRIGSVCGNSASVSVNGKKAPALGFGRLETDITALLKPGENEIAVEVATTLNNRLKARGYYDKVPNLLASMGSDVEAGHDTSEMSIELGSSSNSGIPSEYKDYGMIGETAVIFYKTKGI